MSGVIIKGLGGIQVQKKALTHNERKRVKKLLGDGGEGAMNVVRGILANATRRFRGNGPCSKSNKTSRPAETHRKNTVRQ